MDGGGEREENGVRENGWGRGEREEWGEREWMGQGREKE